MQSASSIDWDSLKFSITPTDTMYMAKCQLDEPWQEGEFLPYGNISISPAAGVLNYAQGIFEGMKARRSSNGEILLFRPEDNAKRFQVGAKRIAMPPVPVDMFVNAIHEIVRRNCDYVPPYGKGSLYIRPCLWGSGPVLGVGAAPEYTFMIYTSPVGLYFKKTLDPIRLLVTQEHHRAAPNGTGGVKYIGNYASTIVPARHAKAQGYHECIYLDAKHDRYIEEVGAANFFCVKDNVLYTPELGSILPGIVRESIITIARELLKMEVVEGLIDIEDVLKADECFGSGTAAVISPIGLINYDGQQTVFNDNQAGPITVKIRELLNAIQLREADDPFGWVVEA